MATPLDQLTHEGYDLQFGVNVLGPFIFSVHVFSSLTSSIRPLLPHTIAAALPQGSGKGVL